MTDYVRTTAEMLIHTGESRLQHALLFLILFKFFLKNIFFYVTYQNGPFLETVMSTSQFKNADIQTADFVMVRPAYKVVTEPIHVYVTKHSLKGRGGCALVV